MESTQRAGKWYHPAASLFLPSVGGGGRLFAVPLEVPVSRYRRSGVVRMITVLNTVARSTNRFVEHPLLFLGSLAL